MENATKALTTTVKVGNSYSDYEPLEMTDESIYDMARHWYTVLEIAERFNVTEKTIMHHHGDAFKLGKHHGMQKPRMLLNKIMSDFDDQEINFSRQDVPTNTLLNAVKLHAQLYQGLGSTQTIVTKTDEKPSVSEIKFVPLQATEE